MFGNEFEPLRHQRQLINAPWVYQEINNIFMIAGYGAGKSTGLVWTALEIARRYWMWPIEIGLGSSTKALLKQTVVKDIVKVLEETGSRYRLNEQKGELTIGKLKFVFVSTGEPEKIYAYNFCAFLNDELDELEQTKALEAIKSVWERTRVTFPPYTEEEHKWYRLYQEAIRQRKPKKEIEALQAKSGRAPFVINTTTSQGLKGTYVLIEELKKKKRPYIHIRAKTSDNPNNDRAYIAELESRYTENEKIAFLEGGFVNLTAGRVYPEYDEAVNMISKDSFTVGDREQLYVGQDLNSGYSKATVWVVRGNAVYCVKEYSFKAIGQAPSILRSDFPTNPILWIPDNSGKPILDGYEQEVIQNDIEMAWVGRNPSILARIFVKNKLFRERRGFILSNCEEYSMALKTRQFDKHGAPEKGQGPKSPDHICDGSEYCLWWIVSNVEAFMDLYELTKVTRREAA